MLGELVDEIRKTASSVLNEAHTAIPGTIVSYDTGSGLATVKPAMQFTKPNGEKIDYPQISGVPVVLSQGSNQNATIAFPINAGDGCLIICCEQSLDKWMYGRETDTDLRFDLTNAVCIPGLFASANSAVAEACASRSVIVDVGGNRVAVSGGGVLVKGDLTVEGSISASVDVSVAGKSMGAHTHKDSSGGNTSAPT